MNGCKRGRGALTRFFPPPRFPGNVEQVVAASISDSLKSYARELGPRIATREPKVGSEQRCSDDCWVVEVAGWSSRVGSGGVSVGAGVTCDPGRGLRARSMCPSRSHPRRGHHPRRVPAAPDAVLHASAPRAL